MNWMAAQITAELHEVYRGCIPALNTVHFLMHDSKRIRTSTEDEACARHPVEVTTPQTVEKKKNIMEFLCSTTKILEAPMLKVRKIVLEELQIKMLGVPWGPRLLTGGLKKYVKGCCHAVSGDD